MTAAALPAASDPPAREQGGALLVASGLSKSYGSFTALQSVSFTLTRGEVIGFLGPNGAGKSTTMKILTGYLAPSAGTATIAGHDLLREPLACRHAIGYLPEELPLYLEMRVDAYLDHVARLKGIPRSERRREVVEAIESAQLTENAHRHIRTLSKGNRQRVGVAQALLGKPPILILDEPTSGLDPAQVLKFRALITSLAARHAILLSTHILSEVEASCSRAVIIHRGRTLADASIEELRSRTASAHGTISLRVRSNDAAELARVLATHGMAGDLLGDSVVVQIPDERRAEVAALAEAHGGLRELVEQRQSLEDVFRDIIAAPPHSGDGSHVGSSPRSA